MQWSIRKSHLLWMALMDTLYVLILTWNKLFALNTYMLVGTGYPRQLVLCQWPKFICHANIGMEYLSAKLHSFGARTKMCLKQKTQ